MPVVSVNKVSPTHLVVQHPADVLQVAVIQEHAAVQAHPHRQLLHTDGPDLRHHIPMNAVDSMSESQLRGRAFKIDEKEG